MDFNIIRNILHNWHNFFKKFKFLIQIFMFFLTKFWINFFNYFDYFNKNFQKNLKTLNKIIKKIKKIFTKPTKAYSNRQNYDYRPSKTKNQQSLVFRNLLFLLHSKKTQTIDGLSNIYSDF